MKLNALALIWQELDEGVSGGADLAFVELKADQAATFVANPFQGCEGTIGVNEFAQDRDDVAGLSGSAAKGKEQPPARFVIDGAAEGLWREVIIRAGKERTPRGQ